MKVIALRSVLLAVALVASSSLAARANTITPSFESFTPGTQINYGIFEITGRIQPGDGFTISDIYGYTGAVAPTNWTASAALLGTTAYIDPTALLLTPDNPSLFNVTFTYNAGAPVIIPVTPIPGFAFVTGFVVQTSGQALTFDNWVSRDHTAAGLSGFPTPGIIQVPAIPDGGSTLAFLGLALLAIGTVRHKIMG